MTNHMRSTLLATTIIGGLAWGASLPAFAQDQLPGVNVQGQSDQPATEIDEGAIEALEAVAETRRRLAEVPASVVVANHAMGLFELAAIHLSAEPVRLADAQIAIDALGLLVDGLGDRLGEPHDTLVAALGNIRVVFEQRLSPTAE